MHPLTTKKRKRTYSSTRVHACTHACCNGVDLLSALRPRPTWHKEQGHAEVLTVQKVCLLSEPQPGIPRRDGVASFAVASGPEPTLEFCLRRGTNQQAAKDNKPDSLCTHLHTYVDVSPDANSANSQHLFLR